MKQSPDQYLEDWLTVDDDLLFLRRIRFERFKFRSKSLFSLMYRPSSSKGLEGYDADLGLDETGLDSTSSGIGVRGNSLRT